MQWSIKPTETKLAQNTLMIETMNRRNRKLDFDLADLQAGVADENLAKYGLKPGDEKTINGHRYIIAGLNIFKTEDETDDYNIVHNHAGLIVVPGTKHSWNDSGKTSVGSDNRGAGYKNCDLQHYLETDVLNMCINDLGSDHLYSMTKRFSSAVDETQMNHGYLTQNGAATDWASVHDCYISALTEPQLFGYVALSSHPRYDVGEGWQWLPVFREYPPSVFFGTDSYFLRNVVRTEAVGMLALGLPNAGNVSGSNTTGTVAVNVMALILYH